MTKRSHEAVHANASTSPPLIPAESAASDEIQPPTKRHRAALEVDGLGFATESFCGLKDSNEDRHVNLLAAFPGPVFCVFDGHGGTATAEYLVRHLINNISNEIQQHIGSKRIATIATIRSTCHREQDRLHELETQQTTLVEQQLQVSELVPSSGPSTGEMQVVVAQLSKTINEVDTEIESIKTAHNQRVTTLREELSQCSVPVRKAILKGFHTTDAQILQKHTINDGSTAVMVWFVASVRSQLSLYTVNLGDSRAVLSRRGKAVELTRDHKPNLPDELQRIAQAGGFVSEINGIHRVHSSAGAGLGLETPALTTYLAVSRAFGDRSLKIPTACVSSEPEIKAFPIKDEDLLVVLATDGIWDVMTSQEAIDIALRHFELPKEAANAVVKEAYKRGSGDNLTATVICFRWKWDLARTVLSEQEQTRQSSSSSVDDAKHQDSVLASESAQAEDEDQVDMFNL